MKRIALIVLAFSPGCASEELSSRDRCTRPESADEWELERVVDGDTIEICMSDGWIEDIRLIGMDTPERGKCGYSEAKKALENIVSHGEISLVLGGTEDRDKYNRLLRYVEVKGEDAGLQLLKEGLAIARYDSRDGYVQHLREDIYIQTDIESPNQCPDSAWQQ